MASTVDPRTLSAGVPSRWIDVSRPLSGTTPVWPGDRPFERHEEAVDGGVVSWLTTTCHVGTHVEVPRHLDVGAPPVERVPLDRLIGPAEVVVVPEGAELIEADSFPAGWSPRAPRVLLRTDSHPLGSRIGPGFTALAAQAVAWLAERGVELLGVDTPSVDPFESTELAAHRALARAGMTWLEGLLLSGVDPGLYLLVALPLPLVGAEASPARVVLGAWD